MMPGALTLRFLLLFATLASSLAYGETPETVKVVAEGRADGVTPASRERATRNAREEAMWLWVESLLGRPRSDDLLPLLDYLDTYTASSRQLSLKLDGGETRVEAEVYLYEQSMRTDVATLLFQQRSSPPVVAFLFIENDEVARIRRFQSDTLAGSKLLEAFRSKGFTVIDPASARSAYAERDFMAMIESGPAALARFGAELGAEAVVSLESRLTARPEKGGGGTLRARADLSLMVVDVSDAVLADRTSVAAEVTAADPASGFGFASDDAVYKIRDRAAVNAVLAARGNDGDRFDLTVEGVRDFAGAERIAERLRGFGGVAGANVLSVRGGVARIQFRYSGRIGAVVDYLESGDPGPGLHAVRVVDREMLFRVDA